MNRIQPMPAVRLDSLIPFVAKHLGWGNANAQLSIQKIQGTKINVFRRFLNEPTLAKEDD
jgi:hypothetical protein